METLRFQEGVIDGDNGVFCLSRVPFARPRQSFHRISSALTLMNSRKSFSYDKLAQVPIQLTVIKLDGSSFEINVTKSATIADVKQAVERIFSHLFTKGLDEVSWRHVWGHFCLSYCGRKLLNDSENIKDHGIKDGDQLHFVRHMSIAYSVVKKQSRKRVDVLRSCTLLKTGSFEEEIQEVQQDNVDLQSPKCQQYKYETVACGLQTVECESRVVRKSCQLYRIRGGLIGYLRDLFHSSDKRVAIYSSRVSQIEI